MAIDGADIGRADRAAARAMHVKPWHAGHESSPDRQRPPHVTTGGQVPIPPLNNAPRLVPRRRVGRAGSQRDGDVVASSANAHRRSIDERREKGEARCRGPLRAGGMGPISCRRRELLRMSKVVKAPRGTPGKRPPAPSLKSRHSVVRRVARARTVDHLNGDGQSSRSARRVHSAVPSRSRRQAAHRRRLGTNLPNLILGENPRQHHRDAARRHT
jgi:hypothetical protein